jgi:hypothetical protein
LLNKPLYIDVYSKKEVDSDWVEKKL